MILKAKQSKKVWRLGLGQFGFPAFMGLAAIIVHGITAVMISVVEKVRAQFN